MEKAARKEREFKARRQEILETAAKMFADKGFYNVTMARIANDSGFSTGSLYQFFKGKEDLYSCMILERLDLMYGQIREKVQTVQGIAEKIEMLIESHFRFVEDNADFCRLFLRGENYAPSDVMNSLRHKIVESYSRHLSFIEDELKYGIDNRFFRPLPAREIASVLFGLIRFSIVDWLLLATGESLSAKKDFILEVFLYGVQQNEK